MTRVYDKPVWLLKAIDDDFLEFETLYALHAYVNTDRAASEYEEAGAEQSRSYLTFEFRFQRPLTAIRHNTQAYRILYDGIMYDVKVYDDFEERHETIKLTGASI